MYLRLAEAANMYQVGKAGLWRPPDLQLALNWQVKHKPTLVWGQRYHPAFERTMIFLEYSKKEFETEQRIKELEAKRKLQRARIVAIVFGVLAGLALLALVYAFVQQGIAKENAILAEANALKATEQAKIADAARKDAEKSAEEAKKQQKIAEQNAIEANRQKLLAEDATKLAQENAVKAEKAAAEAKKQEAIAVVEKKKADANAKAANEARAEAEKQRYQALAKALALKSKELNNTEQRALLAQQAFNFNTKYAGYPFNNEVYNGLFGALKALDDPMTHSLNGHSNAARALVTSVKNNSIYSGGSDGRVIHWSQVNGMWTADTLKNFVDYQIYSIDVSPDGNSLVAGGLYPADRTANYVYLFDLSKPGSEPKKITGFISDIENLHFTNDSKGFYARSNSGKSIMYSDLNTAREVIPCKEKITSIDLNLDGTKLTGGGVDGNLYIWDLKNNYAPSTYSILPQGKDILTVAFTPKGNDVVIGAESGELRIVTNGIVRRILTGHTSHIEQIKFNNSGKFMATASKDKSIRLWNWEDLNQQPQVLNDHDWVWSMAFSPDDNQIMAGIHSIVQNIAPNDVDYTIHVWPTKISAMSGKLCGYVKKNLSKEDWDQFVADDNYQRTCPNLPANDK
jgi:WD40 repeat protein